MIDVNAEDNFNGGTVKSEYVITAIKKDDT